MSSSSFWRTVLVRQQLRNNRFLASNVKRANHKAITRLGYPLSSSGPSSVRWLSALSGNDLSSTNNNNRDDRERSEYHDRKRITQDDRLMALPRPTLEEQRAHQWSTFIQALSDVWVDFVVSAKPPKIPKGFENFFPKQGPATPPSEVDEKQTSGEQTSSTSGVDEETQKTRLSSKEDKTGGSSNNSNKNSNKKPNDDENNDSDAASIPGLLAMLALILALRSYTESDKDVGAGKEITFQEFRRDLLEKGKVQSIQVINKSLAKVWLKPGGGEAPMLMNAASTTPSAGHHKDEAFSSQSTSGPSSTEIDYANSSSILMDGEKPATFYYFFIGSVESLEEKLAKAQQDWHPQDWVEVTYESHTNWALELFKLVPTAAMLAAMYFGTRSMMNFAGRGSRGGGGPGGVFGIGRSNAKKIKPDDVQVSFQDVAGCQQAKMEVMEFVDFLKHPARFTKLGAKIPKGALLCGPPGTGKTLLAKAVAGEAGVPFYSISGSDFIEMFVGVGPSRVRDLFKEARQNSPCIVFIDEVDAVGRQRGRGGFSGGNDERENTLNQLLVEMDGFSSSTNVVVLAGTNRVDILDQALTRPGRFDRQITVDRPDLEGRKEIFLVHLKGITLEGDKEEYAGRLAGLTPGFAGADIANLCNEAAIVAARRKADFVTIADFEKATDRIIGGLESNKIMSDQEKSIVAHHEAGHAVAGWFLEHADPLLKVTIIPRTSGALGFAQYLPKEVFLRSREQIMDIVCMALAGRAAEQVFFGQVTTGASDDLRRVTQIVYSTIKDYGFNSRLGQLAFPDNNNQNSLGGDKPYSDSTAEAMDDEARSIVAEAYQRTVDLITERKEEVAKVANMLLDKETITHDDIVDLIGKRPYGDKAYEEYVSAKAAAAPPTPEKEEGNDDSTSDNEESGGNDSSTLTPGLAFQTPKAGGFSTIFF
mmetsp:Transcript_8209/g.22773  ORF Transcript_8209/g.22773 Transcript_8209/m.22773 type:complete len:931 (-) Transcript_8209:1177-3969(-)